MALKLSSSSTPGVISQQIQQQLDSALGRLAPDEKGAWLLAAEVRDGKPQLASVFAWRTKKGWTIGAEVVAQYKGDLAAGVYLQKVWKA